MLSCLQYSCYNFTQVPEDCSVASQWYRLDTEVSVKLVVLADISPLAVRGFSCLDLNSLRPPTHQKSTRSVYSRLHLKKPVISGHLFLRDQLTRVVTAASASFRLWQKSQMNVKISLMLRNATGKGTENDKRREVGLGPVDMLLRERKIECKVNFAKMINDSSSFLKCRIREAKYPGRGITGSKSFLPI